MLNTVAVLRAELKAARDGVSVSTASPRSSSKSADGAAAEKEDNSGDTTPATADGGDDEFRVEDGRDDSFEGLSPAEEVETSIQHTNTGSSSADIISKTNDWGGVTQELILDWSAQVSSIQAQFSEGKDTLRSRVLETNARNVLAIDFKALPELIISNIVVSARAGKLLDNIGDIARDMCDAYELLQVINEKAEEQTSKDNQRILRMARLGSMMKTLHEMADGVAAEHTHPLLLATVDAMRRVEEDGGEALPVDFREAIDAVAARTKLTEAERSVFTSTLMLVASFEALRLVDEEVEVVGGDSTSGIVRLVGNGPVSGRSVDEQKLRSAVDLFLPDTAWDETKVFELTCVLLAFLAEDDTDMQKKICAIDALLVIFGQRLAKDELVWSLVDEFALNVVDGDDENGAEGHVTFFSRSTKPRYSALRYTTLFCLGNHLDKLLLATDAVDCIEGESFQLTTLRTSVDKVKAALSKNVREKQIFIATSYAEECISGEGSHEAVNSVNTIVKQSQERKLGTQKIGFLVERVLLFDLDCENEEGLCAVASLTDRVASMANGAE